LTVCPVIHSAQEIYKLVTDPSGFWQDQTDQQNADRAYWSDVYNTYRKALNAHVGGVPIGWVPGVPEALFAMKWSADRLDDFDKDPGTSSANIAVFFVSLAIPGSRGVGAVVPKSSVVFKTPGGRVYTAHYLTETGPVRNIPGSVVDNTIEHGQVVQDLSDRTIYYDPVNDVTVVESKTTGKIMSARRGRPKS
jgi:hypothetical protein